MKTKPNSKERVRPLGDRVLVRRTEAEEKTPGGILLPEKAKEKPTRGEVLAVGDGRILDNGELRTPSVKLGDHVLFVPYSGSEVRIGGEDLLIMREEEILAIVS